MGIGALVRYDRDRAGDIATIALDSPKNRNALSHDLVTQLLAAVERAVADSDLRAVVVRAEGPAFCSGADLRATANDRARLYATRAFPRLLTQIATSGPPFVAVVDGPVRGGGLALVAACDIVVATPRANFQLPEVELGLFPAVVIAMLSRRLSFRSLQHFSLTAQVFYPHEAVTAGLVSCELPDTGAGVDNLLASLRSGDPAAMRATKAFREELEGRELRTALDDALEQSHRWFTAWQQR